jgi:hypothetical protein
MATYDEFRRGLLKHIGMEEKILLPAAQQARGGEPLPVAAKLRLQHGAIAALMVPTPTPAIVRALRTMLAAHNEIEEGPSGLYDTCERLLETEAPPPWSFSGHSTARIGWSSREGVLGDGGRRKWWACIGGSP